MEGKLVGDQDRLEIYTGLKCASESCSVPSANFYGRLTSWDAGTDSKSDRALIVHGNRALSLPPI